MGILAVVGAIVVWKSGLLQQLTTSSKNLLEARTTERDDAIRKMNDALKELEELKEENRLLRRECTQRMEINMQDQITIRELREKVGHA